MKIKKLQILDQAVYVGEQGKADDRTHDIAQDAHGYLLRHKASGRVYFVPYCLAVAEVELTEYAEAEEPEGDTDARAAARRPSGRGGRSKGNPQEVQG